MSCGTTAGIRVLFCAGSGRTGLSPSHSLLTAKSRWHLGLAGGEVPAPEGRFGCR